MSFENLKRYCEQNPEENSQLEKLKKLNEKMKEQVQFNRVQVNKYLEEKKKEADNMIKKFEESKL
jgi:hypothetical protein